MFDFYVEKWKKDHFFLPVFLAPHVTIVSLIKPLFLSSPFSTIYFHFRFQLKKTDPITLQLRVVYYVGSYNIQYCIFVDRKVQAQQPLVHCETGYTQLQVEWLEPKHD